MTQERPYQIFPRQAVNEDIKLLTIQLFNNGPDDKRVKMELFGTHHNTTGRDNYYFDLKANGNHQSLKVMQRLFPNIDLEDHLNKLRENTKPLTSFGQCRGKLRNSYYKKCDAALTLSRETAVLKVVIDGVAINVEFDAKLLEWFPENNQPIFQVKIDSTQLYLEDINTKAVRFVPKSKSSPKSDSNQQLHSDPTLKVMVEEQNKNQQEASITEVDRQVQEPMMRLKELIKTKVKELMPIVPSFQKDTKFDYLLNRAINSRIWKTTNDPDVTIKEMIMEARASSY